MKRRSSFLAWSLALACALVAGALAPACGATYSSSSAITITDRSAATPYPAQITVSGLDGQKIAKVRVTLNNITHTNVADVDVLLVGPGGQSVVVLSDFGGSVSGLTLAFDDDAVGTLSGSPTSGSYKPADLGGFLDPFPAPAPARPYGSTLSAFVDTDPNGVWSLYVVDSTTGDAGSIAGGWMLEITTTTAFGGAVTIPSVGAASPYPDSIFITGRHGAVTTVTAQVTLSHTFPDDLDLLLIAPSGQSVVLMSDVGGGDDLSSVSLVFSDAAATQLPDDGPVVAGTFRPTNFEPGDSYPPGPPSGPFGTTLAALTGGNPNGTWKLFVVDDSGSDSGSIASWSLTIATKPSNDDFSTAIVIPPSGSVTAFGSNVGATLELGEPITAGDAPHSVWWTWTPAATGDVLIDTHGSVGDTSLTISTGAAVGSLTQIAYSDNTSTTDATSEYPLRATAGTVYRIAVNGRSTSSGSIALHLTPLTTPVISNSSMTFSTNTAVTWGILASQFPSGYTATGLPPGLTVDPITGRISGTPTTVGVYSVGLGATNSAGTGTSTLTVTIDGKPVLIPMNPIVSTVVNTPFTYTITTANPATSFTATPLPVGLNLNTATGVISGTPTATGTTDIAISATNASGTSSGALRLYVNPISAPVVTSPATASGTVGSLFTYTITATNSPTLLYLSERPAWMSIDSVTGIASGIPDAVGTVSTTALAYNASGTGTKAVAFTFVAAGSTGVTGGAIPGSSHSSSKKCGLGMNSAALLMLLGWAMRRSRSRMDPSQRP